MEDKERKTPQILDKIKIRWKNFKKKIWNSETRQFLGRRGESWAKILAFYFLAFFPFLFAYLAFMMIVLLQTLDSREPKYKMGSSVIGSVPGLGFRPTPPISFNSVKKAEIRFNTTRNETMEHWVSNLNSFLKPYLSTETGINAEQCSTNKTTTKDRVCTFSLQGQKCLPGDQFGYPEGKPCILLKLNRIYDWVPETYIEAPPDLNHLLKEAFEVGFVYITCNGVNSIDKTNVGEINYYPKQGIPSFYYPFTNQKGYISPIVFAEFSSIKRGVLINVECRSWAKNIVYDRQYKKGSVSFDLQVD